MGGVLGILASVLTLGCFVCWIIILIGAFKDEVLQGFLCFCVPFYILYYGFAKWNHPKAKAITGLFVVLILLANGIQFAALASMADQLQDQLPPQ